MVIVDKGSGQTLQEEYEETTFKGGMGKRL